MPDPDQPTVRELLDRVVGARLDAIRFIDHDPPDQATGLLEVVLDFSTGQTLHFWVDEVEGRSDSDASSIHIQAERAPAHHRQIEE